MHKELRGVIGTVSKVMAGSFALAAFAVAIVAGMTGDNSAAHILSRALMAMILCYPVGLIAGIVCERVVAERVRERERENPTAPTATSSGAKTEEESEEEIITA